MASSPKIGPREMRRSRFISRVRHELKKAFAEAKKLGMSQKDIAQKLGVQPSVISRQLNGSANLTLSSIGDLAWALEVYPRINLYRANELEAAESNARIISTTVSQTSHRPQLLSNDVKERGSYIGIGPA